MKNGWFTSGCTLLLIVIVVLVILPMQMVRAQGCTNSDGRPVSCPQSGEPQGADNEKNKKPTRPAPPTKTPTPVPTSTSTLVPVLPALGGFGLGAKKQSLPDAGPIVPPPNPDLPALLGGILAVLILSGLGLGLFLRKAGKPGGVNDGSVNVETVPGSPDSPVLSVPGSPDSPANLSLGNPDFNPGTEHGAVEPTG